MGDDVKIGKRAFLFSVAILLFLMVFAGILTRIIPQGEYTREVVDGTTRIVDGSFQFVNRNSLPVYRWFTAPFEVFTSSDSALIIVIVIFLLFIGGSFSLLMKSGIVPRIMDLLISKYLKVKYKLLAIISLVFMLFGSIFGIFEEMIVLVPFCLVLSRKMGWDSLVGLGMSLLSLALGFSSAIFNPFTLGVAQKLSGLKLYSGTSLRILIFISVYIVQMTFLYRYAKKVEKNPELSSVYEEDLRQNLSEETLVYCDNVDRGIKIFIAFLSIMIITMILGFFIPSISQIVFPLFALLFLIGAIASTLSSGYKGSIFKVLINGMLSVAPAILLIMMATSIKHIIVGGGVMDTVLFYSSGVIKQLSPTLALVFLFALIMLLNFFIGSGSAKAFLLLPIIIPLVDMVGISRQLAVQAFLFGDGFSNVIYPTNAALMVALGFSVVSYPKWFKWTIKIQLSLIAISVFWIFIGVVIGY
ncbi:MAG: hypothetical protein CSB16_00655 [Clostridiales bacterium]|nr:MAG: hypothetical protein CSB16_00655 [Clostridiales bacterium]